MSKPHKHAALIALWGNGAAIQCRSPSHPEWETLGAPGDASQPGWFDDFDYRVKPENLVFYAALVETDSGFYLEPADGDRQHAIANGQGNPIINLVRIELDPAGYVVSATTEKP